MDIYLPRWFGENVFTGRVCNASPLFIGLFCSCRIYWIVPINKGASSEHKQTLREGIALVTSQGTASVSFPFPSVWGIHSSIAGRTIIWGTLNINSITDNRVSGTANFRGTPIPISGFWNESTKQLTFDSPYATFSGNLTIIDDFQIRVRHFILRGRFLMKPPSLQAGESGSWIATTDIALNEFPVSGNTYTEQLPPVGAFLTSNILHQYQNFGGRTI